MRPSTIGLVCFILLQISCTESEIIIPKPSISVSDEIAGTWSGQIHGYITGVEPQSYHLAIYIKIGEQWFSLPENEIPRTLISIENQWFCQTLKYASRNVTQVSIFLFPNSFNAPILEGTKSLPAKLKLLATARAEVDIESER